MLCSAITALKTFVMANAFIRMHSEMYVTRSNQVVGTSLSHTTGFHNHYGNHSDSFHVTMLSDKRYLDCVMSNDIYEAVTVYKNKHSNEYVIYDPSSYKENSFYTEPQFAKLRNELNKRSIQTIRTVSSSKNLRTSREKKSFKKSKKNVKNVKNAKHTSRGKKLRYASAKHLKSKSPGKAKSKRHNKSRKISRHRKLSRKVGKHDHHNGKRYGKLSKKVDHHNGKRYGKLSKKVGKHGKRHRKLGKTNKVKRHDKSIMPHTETTQKNIKKKVKTVTSQKIHGKTDKPKAHVQAVKPHGKTDKPKAHIQAVKPKGKQAAIVKNTKTTAVTPTYKAPKSWLGRLFSG